MLQALVLLLTGFSALVLEVVWARWFATVYGGTVPAGAAVLCSYLGGLALGGFWLGRRADRSAAPNRLLGMLQLGVGALALVSLVIPAVLPVLYGSAVRAGSSGLLRGAVRFALAAVFLLLPGVLMGGTLPAAVRWRGGEDEAGTAGAAGWLRFANCAGAAAGALGAAYALHPRRGLSGTVVAAAGVSFMAAGLAMAFGGGASAEGESAAGTPDFDAVFPGRPGAKPPGKKRRAPKADGEGESRLPAAVGADLLVVLPL